MRAQICFFVSIVFSFVAWGVVTGSLILPELRRRGRNEALRPLLMFHSFRFVGLAFLVPGVVSARFAGGFRRRRRLWRYRRRGARFVDAGLAARQAWHRRGLGIQSLGQRRYPPCQLRRHSPRRPTRSIGRCLLSPNVYRAALSDHARTHVLASPTKRKRSRRAGRAAARLKQTEVEREAHEVRKGWYQPGSQAERNRLRRMLRRGRMVVSSSPMRAMRSHRLLR